MFVFNSYDLPASGPERILLLPSSPISTVSYLH